MTITAVFIEQFGPPEVLRCGEWPEPDAPSAGEIAIQVEASGVNRADAKIRSAGPLPEGRGLPYVVGREAAGTVTAVGDGVDNFAVGDPVFGYFGWGATPGGHAKRLVAPAAVFAQRPASVEATEAAAVPLTGTTAYQALWTLEAAEGDAVLILGAGGGVGALATQIAHNLGLRVLASASAGKAAFIESLGADLVVDYADPSHVSTLRDFDGPVRFVLDCVGGGTAAAAVGALSADATIVALTKDVTDPEVGRVVPFAAKPKSEDLALLARMLDERTLRPTIAHHLPFAAAVEAHRLIEQGHTTGKIVLSPSV